MSGSRHERFDPDDAEALAGLVALAEQAAVAGGHTARRFFRTGLDVRLKADHSEVSQADEAAQRAVLECIRAVRPGDGVIAEEAIAAEADAEGGWSRPSDDVVCWVIDPIDGTRNFIREVPLYACSVAAMHGGFPVAGAIYDPHREVLWSAGRGGGIRLGGQKTGAGSRVRGRASSQRPVVAIPSTPLGESALLAHAWLDRYVCRSLGSTALHLAMVADGELDAMLTDNSRLWDIAAGWLLVAEAGGRTTRLDGSDVFPVAVSAYGGGELPIVAVGNAGFTVR